MPRIILASQSPRRRELLTQAGLKDFEILTPDIDETWDEKLTPEEIVSGISRRKASAVKDGSAIIIAADTMVFSGDLRLGKPKDETEAYAMLKALSGRTHRVLTGLTVRRGNRMETRVEETLVTFRPLKDSEIKAYIKTGDPMDKAGAYGVQGQAAVFVKRIEGDFFNVMGLPLCLLGEALAGFEINLI